MTSFMTNAIQPLTWKLNACIDVVLRTSVFSSQRDKYTQKKTAHFEKLKSILKLLHRRPWGCPCGSDKISFSWHRFHNSETIEVTYRKPCHEKDKLSWKRNFVRAHGQAPWIVLNEAIIFLWKWNNCIFFRQDILTVEKCQKLDRQLSMLG